MWLNFGQTLDTSNCKRNRVPIVHELIGTLENLQFSDDLNLIKCVAYKYFI